MQFSQTTATRRLPPSLKRCLSMVCIVIAGITSTNMSLAQLKTGRATREFYDAPARQPARANYADETVSRNGTIESATYEPDHDRSPEVGYASHVLRSSHDRSKLTARARHGHRNPISNHANCENCGVRAASSEIAVPNRTSSASHSSDQHYSHEPISSEPLHNSEPLHFGQSSRCGCGTCGPKPMMNYIGNSCTDGQCGSLNCNGACRQLNLRKLYFDLRSRLYFRVQAAVFGPTGAALPQLVTTGPASVGSDEVGLADRADTQSLFGDQVANGGTQIGIKLEVGSWFDAAKHKGILYRYFNTGDFDTTFSADSLSQSVLARPFFDVVANAQATQLISFPGLADGSVDASFQTNSFGGDILYRRAVTCYHRSRWDLLLGYQFVRLDDSVVISSSTTDTVATLNVQDSFQTRNSFNGFAIGTTNSIKGRRWSLESLIKLGFGSVDREVTIAGFTETIVSPTNQAIDDQGLLARDTNSGVFSDETFVVVPEVGFTLNYRWSKNLDWNIGYSFIGLAKVARAPEQIDLSSNLSSPLTGTIAPTFVLNSENFGLNSFNFGGQFRY